MDMGTSFTKAYREIQSLIYLLTMDPWKININLRKKPTIVVLRLWIRLLQSLVYQELEEYESANRLFFNALFLAEPEGYVRTIIDAGKLVIPLLNSAISNKITPFLCKVPPTQFNDCTRLACQ